MLGGLVGGASASVGRQATTTAPAGLHPRLQEHRDRQGGLRVAGRRTSRRRASRRRRSPELPQPRRRDNTIRVDSKVVARDATPAARKSDESRWMRFTLDTVGKTRLAARPPGPADLPRRLRGAREKLERPLHPPGRDVRCIVSVGMLTEGWDCNTVTHIVGLRPFMSQLLCEQVVGRGPAPARATSWTRTASSTEEVAQIFGVPFEVIPFKAARRAPNRKTPPQRHHVHAVPAKASSRSLSRG